MHAYYNTLPQSQFFYACIDITKYNEQFAYTEILLFSKASPKRRAPF